MGMGGAAGLMVAQLLLYKFVLSIKTSPYSFSTFLMCHVSSLKTILLVSAERKTAVETSYQNNIYYNIYIYYYKYASDNFPQISLLAHKGQQLKGPILFKIHFTNVF